MNLNLATALLTAALVGISGSALAQTVQKKVQEMEAKQKKAGKAPAQKKGIAGRVEKAKAEKAANEKAATEKKAKAEKKK